MKRYEKNRKTDDRKILNNEKWDKISGEGWFKGHDEGRDEELERILSPLRGLRPASSDLKRWQQTAGTVNLFHKSDGSAAKGSPFVKMLFMINSVLAVMMIAFLFLPFKTVSSAGYYFETEYDSEKKNVFSGIKNLSFVSKIRFLPNAGIEKNHADRLRFYISRSAEGSVWESDGLNRTIDELLQIPGVHSVSRSPVYIHARVPLWEMAFMRISGKEYRFSPEQIQKGISDYVVAREMNQNSSGGHVKKRVTIDIPQRVVRRVNLD